MSQRQVIDAVVGHGASDAVDTREAVGGTNQAVKYLGLEVGNDLVNQRLRLHADELTIVFANVLLVAVPVVVLLSHSNRVVREKHIAVVAIALPHSSATIPRTTRILPNLLVHN